MRSRYTAFVLRDADHLWRTWHPRTRPAQVGDLDGVLDALGIERAHVVGLSMGAMIAQRVALLAPDKLGPQLTAVVEVTLDRQGAEHLLAFQQQAVADAGVQQGHGGAQIRPVHRHELLEQRQILDPLPQFAAAT